ncbi:shikimate kinase [Paenibacillus sp. CAA11]|uniref:shikimate kinase n=1 Tax=Paenibacillus sp. CAA11 TaxID=1532905 RepID=UPI000D38FEF6|nr:shikimate kinase [Paenibacillus sp. CAA11]AWB45201.1 shikimate kinase [Paenibacillus sp. CAA11]
MQREEENLILIGMMGTGKSTVAAMLAEQTGRQLVDLDLEVATAAGCSIPEIFETRGESYFRQLEAQTLKRVLSGDGIVLATGGGAVLNPANRAEMLQRGRVIALKADVSTILSRVGEDPNRPLLAGGAEQRIRELLEARKFAYDFAHCTVETSGKSAGQVTSEILARYRV